MEWHSIEECLPEEGRYVPIWMTSRFTRTEFSEFGMLSDGEWYVGSKKVSTYGWTVLAWYDLPKYREAEYTFVAPVQRYMTSGEE